MLPIQYLARHNGNGSIRQMNPKVVHMAGWLLRGVGVLVMAGLFTAACSGGDDGTAVDTVSAAGSDCCPPPPTVSNFEARTGPGSGEVVIGWDPVPAAEDVAFYRVYRKHREGYLHLAVVTAESARASSPEGRIELVDAFDYWPLPSGATDKNRCYTVTAVARGLEGPFSAEACASAPGE